MTTPNIASVHRGDEMVATCDLCPWTSRRPVRDIEGYALHARDIAEHAKAHGSGSGYFDTLRGWTPFCAAVTS